ncbi:restriction endonuclease subunit S, partial [Helicobacter pylori]
LFHTLAPKGVEFKKIGEICLIKRGRVIAKKILQENGKYPVYSSQTLNNGILGFIDTYDFDGEFLTWTTDGAYAGSVFYRNGRFSITNVCGLLQVIQDNILHKYLYYILQITAPLHVSSGMGNPKLMSATMQQITIPIPPLEIQQEIVKILDAFTELNTELNAELNTELNARKKQYKYYQNMLLDFNDINQSCKDAKEKLAQKTYPKRLKTLLQTLAPKGVEFRKLGEVLEYDQPNQYCVTSKEFDKSYPTPVLTAGKTFILGYTNEKDNIYQASKNAPVIIFDDFTTATQWVDFPFKVKSSAMKILLPKNPIINIRFIFFYMQTIPYNIGGEHARHWISRYSQLEVPIPPLEIQQEIVKILDQFSILTTDLLAGIPAEIKARKKQYEYYREKLLAFKPLTPHKEVKKG